MYAKKNIIILSVLFFGLFALVASCQQDENRSDEVKKEAYSGETTAEFLARAQAYFENTYDPALKTKSAEQSPVLTRLSGEDFTPMWERSRMSSGKTFAYLEFPLIINYQFIVQHKDVPDGILTQQRLVMRRDQKTGELEMFTSLIIPDAGTALS